MSAPRTLALALGLVVLGLATAARADDFTFLPPGDLAAGSGQGRVDQTVYAPDIRFPIEQGAAFANSQVWGHGGNSGPGGSQCDKENFSYPWRDNFCETRSWNMPLCPAGQGHQGQDVRAADCVKLKHWAAAVTDGTITSIGSYTVYLTDANGTRFDYLHMENVQVKVGQKVKRGDHVGMVSNNFGTSSTTVHLHFNIQQNVKNVGVVFVPPYLSLVKAYKATLEQPARGAIESVGCNGLRGWAFDGDQPDVAVAVRIGVDGAMPAADATLTAGDARMDLCNSLGSCGHGFAVPAPLSLFDGKQHSVHFYAVDTQKGTSSEMLESPQTLHCGPITPSGARRAVSAGVAKAWGFTAFWDQLPAGGAALPAGEAFDVPEILADPADAATWWVVDGGARRKLAKSDAAGWHLAADAASLPGADFDTIAVGAPMPARAELVSVGGAQYLLDVASPAPPAPGAGPAGEDPGTTARGSCAAGPGSPDDRAAWLTIATCMAIALRRRGRR